MTLELWLKKNDNGKSDCFDLTIGQEEILSGKIKNLHVIGTCAECEHSGGCDIENFIFRSPEYNSPDEFGCTHYQIKEGDEKP